MDDKVSSRRLERKIRGRKYKVDDEAATIQMQYRQWGRFDNVDNKLKFGHSWFKRSSGYLGEHENVLLNTWIISFTSWGKTLG